MAFSARRKGLANVLKTPVFVAPPDFAPGEGWHPGPVDARKYVAIWDTGATGTVISQKIVDDFNLPPIGQCEVHTASGLDRTERYLISLGLPNQVFIATIPVIRGCVSTHDDVLIGMDVMALGDFAVTNHKGKTQFSFRMPSVGPIDFVAQNHVHTRLSASPSYTGPKVGRNDPCPCGSGKKYKKCCGR